MTVELERLEAKFAVGEGNGDDLDLYQRTAGNLRRLLEAVGLGRRMKDVSAFTITQGINVREQLLLLLNDIAIRQSS